MHVITNVLVPGRGHALNEAGELCLSNSSTARVQVAADYYTDNAEDFETQGGLICFEGGWAAAAAGMPRPPKHLREGRLMRMQAIAAGVSAAKSVEGVESTTTMSNCLHSRHHFAGVGRLAIVTQVSQADRLLFCAGKAFPGTELSIIEASGEDDVAIIADERRLLAQSRLLYGWANSPRALAVADQLGVWLGKLAGARPGQNYGALGDADEV